MHKKSGQDLSAFFFVNNFKKTKYYKENNMENLIKQWANRYLVLEGENPDDYKADRQFNDADEYEEWMKEREKMIAQNEQKPIKEDDDENEEEEEENLFEKMNETKEKLVSTIEKLLEKREEYEEDEIKEAIKLLIQIDPEKVSEEDKALVSEIPEENTENNEEVPEEN
jgi:hypothetical protein